MVPSSARSASASSASPRGDALLFFRPCASTRVMHRQSILAGSRPLVGARMEAANPSDFRVPNVCCTHFIFLSFAVHQLPRKLASPADVRRVGGRGCSRTGESPIDHQGAVPSSPRARVSMYLARQSTLTAVTPNCCRCNLRVTIPQQNSLCCEGPRAPEPCLARNMAWRDTLRSSRSRGGFFGSD